jgi:hypothetical protein
MLGHDKSVYVAPNGTAVLVPNFDDQVFMISAFQICEFGSGMEICEKDLKKIMKEGEDKVCR